MSQINPFIGAMLQSPVAIKQSAVERDRTLRRATELRKDSSLTEDRVELQVESVDASEDSGNDSKREQPQRHSKNSGDDDERERLDLTA